MKTEDLKNMTVRIPPELWDELAKRAIDWRVSRNQIMIFAVKHLLKSVPASAKIEETLTIIDQKKED